MPVEIKASTTYHGDFKKGLDRFDAIVDAQTGGYVIYGGDQRVEGDKLRLASYKNTAQIFS